MTGANKVKRYTAQGFRFKAIQFLDEVETIIEISNWFADYGFKETAIDYEVIPPVLKVYETPESDLVKLAKPGDYVVMSQRGKFFTYPGEMFERIFELMKE